MKKLLIILSVLAALVWGGWLVAVPADVITDFVEDTASRGDIEVRINDFRKGLFYSFTAESVDIMTEGRTLLTVENVQGRLSFPALLTLKVRLPFEAELSEGLIQGTVVLDRTGYEAWAAADGVELEGLRLKDLTGIGISGTMRGDGNVVNGFGKVRFLVNDAHADPVTVQNMQVPLDMFKTIRGAFHVDGPKVDIDSITFEGEGMYARVTGTVEGSYGDIELEFMPSEDVIPDAILQSVIGQYRVSMGHYLIPYRGPLRGAL